VSGSRNERDRGSRDVARNLNVDDLISLLDRAVWNATKTRYEAIFREAERYGRPKDRIKRLESNYSKYFDLDRWLPFHLRNAQQLCLHQTERRLRVLDIACGSGLFLFVCKSLGHEVLGFDVGSQMYADMARVLGVPWVQSLVTPMQPLDPQFTGFDVISAISIKFDREDFGTNRREPWRLEEWEFFLGDIAARLNPGGKIYIKPNLNANGVPFEDIRILDFLYEKASRVLPDPAFILPRDCLI
jgi:SAM-dependent methyltransferase